MDNVEVRGSLTRFPPFMLVLTHFCASLSPVHTERGVPSRTRSILGDFALILLFCYPFWGLQAPLNGLGKWLTSIRESEEMKVIIIYSLCPRACALSLLRALSICLSLSRSSQLLYY